jgi:hypothetical protein
MESTAAQPAKVKTAHQAPLKGPERPGSERPLPGVPAAQHGPRGYGLPCSRCRVYYPADMAACPICKATERVSASVPVQVSPAIPPAAKQGEDQRERLLKELKSQIFASHTQINAAATFHCCLDQNHNGNVEPAAVCHSCYAEARQLADRLEAALHIELKEAAQIVYEAVWADTSDSGKTYENAATALLVELRKRAGISPVLGSMQSLAH